jgi:hypothetical protein
MREIVSDPERGQAYLDYFVKKCGITNLDRYPMSMLDGVYKDRDNKDKPFGLMVLARADENQNQREYFFERHPQRTFHRSEEQSHATRQLQSKNVKDSH